MTLQYGVPQGSVLGALEYSTNMLRIWHFCLSWASTSSVCWQYARLLQWMLRWHSCDGFKNWTMCFWH